MVIAQRSPGLRLERWINKTQGDNPTDRAKRKPGLLWAITMFDMRITSDLTKDEDMLKMSWGQGGIVKTNNSRTFRKLIHG